MTTTWKGSDTIIHPPWCCFIFWSGSDYLPRLHAISETFLRGAPSSSGACDLVSRPVPQAKGIRSRKTTRPKLKGIDGYSKPMRVVSSESTFTILSFTRGQATLVRHPTYKSRRSAPKPFTAFRGAEGDTQWPRPDDRPAGNLRWTSKRTKFHGIKPKLQISTRLAWPPRHVSCLKYGISLRVTTGWQWWSHPQTSNDFSWEAKGIYDHLWDQLPFNKK